MDGWWMMNGWMDGWAGNIPKPLILKETDFSPLRVARPLLRIIHSHQIFTSLKTTILPCCVPFFCVNSCHHFFFFLLHSKAAKQAKQQGSVLLSELRVAFISHREIVLFKVPTPRGEANKWGEHCLIRGPVYGTPRRAWLKLETVLITLWYRQQKASEVAENPAAQPHFCCSAKTYIYIYI